MRYQPRAPREGINISPEHPLREAGTLLFGLVAVLVVGGALIGFGVELAVGLIPADFEARMFPAEEVDSDLDPQTAAAQALLDRLAAHWPEAPYRFRVTLLQTDQVNAAALPGGTLLVTSGLLARAGSENELAFVLGHELGHFRGRHHLRRLGRRAVYAMALGALLGRAGAAGDLGALTGELTSRGFDREQEREADAFGLSLVAAEYGHVGGATELFDHLSGAGPELERVVAYFSTHPAGDDRSAELERLAAAQGWPSDGVRRELSPSLR